MMVLVGMVTAVTLGGCVLRGESDELMWEDQDELSEDLPGFEEESEMPVEIPVGNAHLEGDFGPALGFANDSALVGAYGVNGDATVDIDAGEVGLRLRFLGGLDHQVFRPGARLTFGDFGYPDELGREVSVNGNGCVWPGPSYHDSFDDIGISVDNGSVPGGLRFDFVATLTYGERQTVTGSFETLCAGALSSSDDAFSQ
jgi:hypothetical protein